MNYCKFLLLLWLPLALPAQRHMVEFLHRQSRLVLHEGYGELQLAFRIASGYHIQADSAQMTEEFLIPTSLSIAPDASLTLCQVNFPPASAMHLDGKMTIQVWGGTLLVGLELEAVPELASGTYPLRGQLHYQACDKRKCFFPRELDFEVPVSYHPQTDRQSKRWAASHR